MNIVDGVKFLFKARQPIAELVAEAKGYKTGYKTFAFWATVLLSLGAFAACLQGILPASAFLVLTTVLTAAYNIVRSLEKADLEGSKPAWQSTEFWLGMGNILLQSIATLKTGGFNPAWLIPANTTIAGIMAMAQNLAASNPPTKPA